MSAEGNSRPIGPTQNNFKENASLPCEPDESHIHLSPTQATERPDLNGTEGGAEHLVEQSSLIQKPQAEQTTVAVSGPSASSMIVGSVSSPRISRLEDVSEEEPSKQLQGILILGRSVYICASKAV